MLAMGPAQQSFAEGYSGRLLCPLEVVPIVGLAFEFARVIPAGVRRTGLDP